MDNRSLSAAASECLLFVTRRPPIVMDRGEGMLLFDVEGRRYLDFVGGWAVTALGHSPPVLRRALDEQSARLVNASPAFVNRPQVELARRLTRLAGLEKVWFGSSGAEVNEAAVKLARKHGARRKGGHYRIVTATDGFHGRTLATMSATGKASFKALFEPKVPGFVHVPFNDVAALERELSEDVVALMLEPVQGEAGVRAARQDYLRRARALCDERGILLVLDEVQTGMGRTGTLFCFEQYGITPDILTLGKGLGGGFPLAAILARSSCDLFDAGDHGGTFGGQPLAMAVGLAVIEEILEKELPQRAEKMGRYLREGLAHLGGGCLRDIRGRGLLVGADLPAPFGEALVARCLEKGLLVNSPRPGIIRLMPPLVVERHHIDEMLATLEAALAETPGAQPTN